MTGECNFDYKIKVASFDTGAKSKMRLSSILKYQEQAGEIHLATDYGYDYNSIRKNGVVFVLVNTESIIHRMPTFGENWTIHTWNKQLKGLKFYRSYNWIDENGETIIESTSVFVLVSAIEHKIVKPAALGFELPTEDDHENAVKNPNKTHLPKELEKIGSKKILFSMLDTNDHLNNALYADFLVDFIEPKKALNIKRFTLDYVKEAVLGEKIDVFFAEEYGTIYLKGDKENETCFRAIIEY